MDPISQILAEAAGWKDFREVTRFVPCGHKLFRASAPNYDGHDDASQKLTEEAVQYLVDKGIDSIISYNEYEYEPEQKKLLDKPKIKYLWLKLGDSKPPTLAQLKEANDFLTDLKNKSTLIHCGAGDGRTGTGITGLQIYTEQGKNLQPLASSWIACFGSNGNGVENREQVSILAEQRNIFFPRVTGIPAGDPKHAFAIINFATGYYLAVSAGKVTSQSPDSVETKDSIQEAFQWVITKDGEYYTLSNKKVPTSFALTKAKDAKANDPVTYGENTEGNTLFTIQEATTGDKGRYIISPKSDTTLAVSIKEPNNDKHPALTKLANAYLVSKVGNNLKFGLWILLTSEFR